MSATKNKAIDKLNEPAKPTAARKKAIKKAVTAVVERQAVEVTPILSEEEIADAIKKYVLPDSSLHGEAVAQITTVIPPIEPVEQPTEPTPTFKQKAAALWAKEKDTVVKIAFFAILIGTMVALIYNQIRLWQTNKQLRQTQQVESNVEDEKANLGQTEANLSHMQQIKRSAETLNATIDSMQQITAREAEEHQRVYDLAKKYKLQNYELQNLIRDANDSTLRAYGAKPSN